MNASDFNSPNKPDWCPGCLLPGTLINKNPSIDKVENIKEGDRVLGSDGDYHEVTEVFIHNHSGKMYCIKSKCLGKTTLTEEHPVLSVKRKNINMHNTEFELQWTRADQLKKGDYLAFPIPKAENDLEELELPVKKKFMDRKSKALPKKIPISGSFMRLCGYYLAEGAVHDREISFTFNNKEQAFAEDVSQTVKGVFSLQTTAKTREKKHTTDVTINSSLLSRVFSEWFGTGAGKKKIPHFMMLLSRQKQKELIKGMWRGDGWVGKGRANYKTTSRVLAEQLKLLLIRQRIVPTISVNHAYGIHAESYSVQIVSRRDMKALSDILEMPVQLRNEGRPPSSILLEDFVLTPIREIETFDYNGPVHNFEVETVHSYVGENAVLHNCGDFAILLSLKNALAKANCSPKDTVIVSGIGCSGKLPHFAKTYAYEALHGRALPVASGVKLANNTLKVAVVGGDGDGYGIGMGHFIHAMRRNIDLKYLVHNNQVYGLTTGQTSPTSEKGFKTRSTPFGVIEVPVNPLALAISSGATFVARGFSGDMPHLTSLIQEALNHKGFALVDVLQPCVTFNKLNTYPFFQKNCYKLEQNGHNPSDKPAAFQKSLEWGEGKIPIGIFYKESRPTYEDELPTIAKEPLCRHDISNVDVSKILDELE